VAERLKAIVLKTI